MKFRTERRQPLKIFYHAVVLETTQNSEPLGQRAKSIKKRPLCVLRVIYAKLVIFSIIFL